MPGGREPAEVEGHRDRRLDGHDDEEHEVTSFLGYAYGVKAPGATSWPRAIAAAHHTLLSHGAAVRAFRERGGEGRIGITLDLTIAEPASESPEDVAAAQRLDAHHNRWFLEPVFRASYPSDMVELYERTFGPLEVVRDGDLDLIAQPIDFVGVNFYRPNLVAADPSHPPLELREAERSGPHTAMNWPIVPQALTGSSCGWRGLPHTPLYIPRTVLPSTTS